LRIYPLLFISYAVVSIVKGSWLNDDRWILLPYGWDHTLAYQNSVLWTLAVEIQLYVLTPLLAVVMASTFLRNRTTLTIVSAIFLISAITMASVLITHNTARVDDRSMLGNLGFYLFGMALAVHRNRVEMFVQRWWRPLIVTTGLYCVTFLVAYNVFSLGILFYVGQPLVILTGLIVLGAATPLCAWGRQIFTMLGHSTYEIYALHGLGAFLFTQYAADTGWMWVIVLEWAFPVLAALAMAELFSQFLALFKRPRGLIF
jgi:peptidoglycan/LPS O-acetylase OafA/YrhL